MRREKCCCEENPPRVSCLIVTGAVASVVSKAPISMTLYLLAGSLMLSWVALYNGAPLVFPDTISYATSAYRLEVPGLFSIFYSFFILPFHWGVSFWPVVFVQGAVVAHLLLLTARSVFNGRVDMLEMLLIVGALGVFSSLPWVTGQILPDVFTPVVLLSIFLLAFSENRLTRTEIFYVSALAVLAIATHLSHVPIACGLIVLAISMKFLLLRDQFRPGSLSLRLGLPLCIAIVLLVGANWISSREVGLSRNSNVFLLAKWIDEGPALSYLKRTCPSTGYALCRHLKDLEGKTHDDLKWGHNSPFHKVGTFDQLEPEARSIVRATFWTYPSAIVRQALANVGLQFTRFQAGDGLSPQFAEMVGRHVGGIFGPAVGNAFIGSKQGHGHLPISEFRLVHLVSLGIAAAVCVASIAFWRNALPGKLGALLSFVVLGIAWNAIVTGAVSGPYDRYLARVIWLVCFVALLLARGALKDKRILPGRRPGLRQSVGLGQCHSAR